MVAAGISSLVVQTRLGPRGGVGWYVTAPGGKVVGSGVEPTADRAAKRASRFVSDYQAAADRKSKEQPWEGRGDE